MCRIARAGGGVAASNRFRRDRFAAQALIERRRAVVIADGVAPGGGEQAASPFRLTQVKRDPKKKKPGEGQAISRFG